MGVLEKLHLSSDEFFGTHGRTYFASLSVTDRTQILTHVFHYPRATSIPYLLLIDVDVGAALTLAGQGVYTVFLMPRRFVENNGIFYCSNMEEDLFST